MSLLACPNCSKFNQTTRKACWNCSSTLSQHKGDSWARGTYAYRRNPSDPYAIKNIEAIKRSSDHIENSTNFKPWMHSTIKIVCNDLEKMVKKLHGKIISEEPSPKLIKNYADQLSNLLNSNIEVENWMRSKLSATASRMQDISDGLRMHRNPIIDPKLGQDIARQIFFKNPKGETRMRSMKRFKRNPNSWNKYLRRNPQAPVWGSSLFGKSGVWGNTLYKSRKLRRHNPQAPVWGSPTFGKDAVWGKTLFKKYRNPQAPVWGAPTFGKDAVWGKTLFKRRNPQAPVWGSPTFGKDAVWGKTLFKRNPDECPVCLHVDCDCGCDPISGIGCLCERRNPQAPVWGSPTFGKDAVWGKTLFKRRNPQAPVWGSPTFGKDAVWGKTLFRNPDEDLDMDDDWHCSSDWNRNPNDMDGDFRCNPEDDLFEEDIVEEPSFRRYRRN